ncbi:RNA-binding protein 33 [Astyanax mexicanus]|uniref:RNA-binding protein 33 n=1 Tax=Astyanax mexicanus TaxID=7994 RepID=A0A8T2LS27_ASTMX|nr:RNA-binding protein 33 [Astyanax mexicanus]
MLLCVFLDEFNEYDKPGAERSRRRRGEDDDLDSDLEEDLLEEDWLSSKKNPSELSDEELNDDLLQSDEEDQNGGGQGEAVSLNATLGFSTSYDLQEENQEGGGYGEEGYDETGEGGFSQEGGEYGQEEGMEYSTGQNDEAYEDEVLELQIDEPLDDEFQVGDYSGGYSAEQPQEHTDQPEEPEAEEEEPQAEGEDQDGSSQVTESEELEPEPEPEPELEQEAEEAKEESDEDDDEEESGRLRFKKERTDVTVVRLSDAASKRRNIPETLELTEEAKADLLEFEEKERQRKQGRFGGRGRGGGGGRGGMQGNRGRGGGGGRGGLPMFGMGDFRGDGGVGRDRMNEQRPPLMQVNLGMQPRMALPQSHHHHHHHHHQPRHPGPRGSQGLFANPINPIPQQPLQMLLPHRSPGPPPRPQPDLHRPPPPANHTHSNQQQQQQQPKNIHINPHFRGPASSPVQVPLMPPTQNQPRPNISPQRFPGPADFQQHLQGSFVQHQRPPPQDQWRGPPPPHQEREPFFNSEPRFPGQHLFDLPGPAPLMNNNLLSLTGQNPLSFPQPGGLGGAPGPGPNFGPLGIGQGQGPPGGGGMFQREPPRPNLQHSGPPVSPGPRGFMGHRQPFPPQQPGPPFSPQHMNFGMQVRQRGIMQPHSQPPHHDSPPSHHSLHHQQQQQHRQDLQQHGHPQQHPPPPHNQHHQRQPAEQHPILQLSHPPFRQPLQGGPRQLQQRSQNGQQRGNPGRMRMMSPSSMQQLQGPQRNSNLRELPIAPGNTTVRQAPPTNQPKPGTRATQEPRPGQVPPGGAAGRGRGAPKAAQRPAQPPALTETQKEPAPARPSAPAQVPDEDEETRQYRLKIEEQKRLREEILKRKEMRRQMQAGLRKKELMERIGSQNPNQTQTQTQPQPHPLPPTQNTPTPPSSQPQPAPQPPQQIPSALAPNGDPQTPAQPRGNVKARIQTSRPDPLSTRTEPVPQLQQIQQLQQQRRPPAQQNPPRQFPIPTGNPQPQAPRPGGKRTVMQRANVGGSSQIPQKVRVVKRLTGGDVGPNPSAPLPPPLSPLSSSHPQQHQQLQPPSQQQQQQQHPQQPQQQQQQMGRPLPQQRISTVRKVTVAPGGAQQPPPPPQEAAAAGGGAANQANRVVVPGRGRGRGAPGGRGGGGRMVQQARPSPRAPDTPQLSTVSIDGLSSTTTEKQIKNLLNSIGPIQMFKMLPQQRKAVAKFVNPQHALSFQHSFHRHMIDLSHIDVTIIEG